MSVYTPHLAPVVVLAFLGTGGLLVLCLFVALVGALRKSRSVFLGAVGAGAIILAGYASMLLGLSLLSRDVVIARGAWKYFCELDCHIGYTIGEARFASSVGSEFQPVSPDGKFVIVELRAWFDPLTVSPHRGNGPLTPNGRLVSLVDERGRKFELSGKSGPVLAAAGLYSTPLETALRPGQTYVSIVVFEVPSDAKGLKLLLTSSDPEDFLIWGEESSPFHGKAYFSLPQT